MVKSSGGQRESEGVVVPVIGVQHNAPGGKDPRFDHAGNAGKRKGMAGTSRSNSPGGLQPVVLEGQRSSGKAGQAQAWTDDWFNGHGLHRLRGTVRYPKAA